MDFQINNRSTMMRTMKYLVLFVLIFSCAPEYSGETNVNPGNQTGNVGTSVNDINEQLTLRIPHEIGEAEIDLLGSGYPLKAQDASSMSNSNTENAFIFKNGFKVEYTLDSVFKNTIETNVSYMDRLTIRLEEDGKQFLYTLDLTVVVEKSGSGSGTVDKDLESLPPWSFSSTLFLTYENDLTATFEPDLSSSQIISKYQHDGFSLVGVDIVDGGKAIKFTGSSGSNTEDLSMTFEVLDQDTNEKKKVSLTGRVSSRGFNKDPSRATLELEMGAFGEGRLSYREASSNPAADATDFSPLTGISFSSSRVIRDDAEELDLSDSNEFLEFSISNIGILYEFKPDLSEIDGTETHEQMIEVAFLKSDGSEEIVDVLLKYSIYDLDDEDSKVALDQDKITQKVWNAGSDATLREQINLRNYDINDLSSEFGNQMRILSLECIGLNTNSGWNAQETFEIDVTLDSTGLDPDRFRLESESARYYDNPNPLGLNGTNFYIMCFGEFINERTGEVFTTIDRDDFEAQGLKNFHRNGGENRTIFLQYEKGGINGPLG